MFFPGVTNLKQGDRKWAIAEGIRKAQQCDRTGPDSRNTKPKVIVIAILSESLNELSQEKGVAEATP
jgi:hypothetical protein